MMHIFSQASGARAGTRSTPFFLALKGIAAGAALIFGTCIGAASAMAQPVAQAAIEDRASGLSAALDAQGAYRVSWAPGRWIFRGTLPFVPMAIRSAKGADLAGDFQQIEAQEAGGFGRDYQIRIYGGRATVLFRAEARSMPASHVAFPDFQAFPRLPRSFSFGHEAFAPMLFDLSGEAPWIQAAPGVGAFVLSPASHAMVAGNRLLGGRLATAIEPQVTEAPEQLQFEAALAFGRTIGSALEAWGRFLTARAGRDRGENANDPMLRTLGYWTDNRSAYWYNYQGALGYDGTLIAARDEFARNGLPLGYMQLDSWWYLKGAELGQAPTWKQTSFQHGVYLLKAPDDLVAGGLPALSASLDLPLATHSRWIDAASPYRATYAFSGGVSVDPAFWRHAMAELAHANVAVYEQDWLNEKAMPRLDRLADGDAFLGAMAMAAREAGLAIQYCMPLARHFIMGAQYPEVSTIRTSGDGFERSKWTPFLFGAALAQAVGIRPFTDVVMSEGQMSVVLAALSGGPVGAGDRIREGASPAADSNPAWCGSEMACTGLNPANLRPVARADGALVKPDQGLVPLEQSYLDPGLMLAQARTAFSGSPETAASYLIGYSDRGRAPARLSLDELGIKGPAYLYDYFAGTGVALPARSSMQVDLDRGLRYWVAVPLLEGSLAVIGDVSQYATLGQARIGARKRPGQVELAIRFAARESRADIEVYSAKGAPRGLKARGAVARLAPGRGPGLWQIQVERGDAAFAGEATATLRL
jgi:hypothetical protein